MEETGKRMLECSTLPTMQDVAHILWDVHQTLPLLPVGGGSTLAQVLKSLLACQSKANIGDTSDDFDLNVRLRILQ